MKVVIRTDSSLQIGTGHVMRCLTLAEKLRARGADVTFVCREHLGHLCDMIEAASYRVIRLRPPVAGGAQHLTGVLAHSPWLGVSQMEDAMETRAGLGAESFDWLIVDHYALDSTWESVFRAVASRIFVIDDLADRLHDCDVLLDQNLHELMEERYTELVSTTCRVLLSPKYALLRNEFQNARDHCRRRDGELSRVLVFFGGADVQNVTMKALHALANARLSDLGITVVVGAANPHRDTIGAYCDGRQNITYKYDSQNMAQLMANADLALGGGGTTTWERCALGLPSLVITLGENQIPIARAAERSGLIRYLGQAETVTEEMISEAIVRLIASPDTLCTMSRTAMAFVDGNGSERVCEVIEGD